jgi:sugar lactone lactonase YvrE
MPEPESIMSGIAFGESPRWHDGRLWVCDWAASELIALKPGEDSEVITQVHSFPFCIDFEPDGALLIVSARERRLLRRWTDGALETVADLGALSEHPWNDIVVDGRGNAYVNNIGFDFPGGEFAPGSIALATPGGAVRTVADGLAFPNGMAVTPDNRTLIVAESYGGRLTAFDIAPDGGLDNQRVWAQLGEGVPPDGICIDAEGAVWYADVPNRRCRRVREGGDVLDTVALDRGAFACMLGGDDGRTLFIVGQEWQGTGGAGSGERTGHVFSVRAPAASAGWPGAGAAAVGTTS